MWISFLRSGIVPCVLRNQLVIRIEPRVTEHLNFKVCPGVLHDLDRAAVRFGASRSAVARALLQGALEGLNFEQASAVERESAQGWGPQPSHGARDQASTSALGSSRH